MKKTTVIALIIIILIILAILIAIPATRKKVSSGINSVGKSLGMVSTEEEITASDNIFTANWKRAKNFTKETLGFNKGLGNFFFYLIMGLAAGTWIWGINRLIYFTSLPRLLLSWKNAKLEQRKHKRSWINTIGGRAWKIIIIGMVYATVMSIPILNRFLQIVTFEVLMPSITFFHIFIKSFIIAFYIGFLPAGIERYTRYRMRLRYYKEIMQAKYGVKIAKGMSNR